MTDTDQELGNTSRLGNNKPIPPEQVEKAVVDQINNFDNDSGGGADPVAPETIPATDKRAVSLRDEIAAKRQRGRVFKEDEGDDVELAKSGGMDVEVVDLVDRAEDFPIVDRDRGKMVKADDYADEGDDDKPARKAKPSTEVKPEIQEDDDPFIDLEIDGTMTKVRRSKVQQVINQQIQASRQPQAPQQEQASQAPVMKGHEDDPDFEEEVEKFNEMLSDSPRDGFTKLDEIIKKRVTAAIGNVDQTVKQTLTEERVNAEINGYAKEFSEKYEDLVTDRHLQAVTFSRVRDELAADLKAIGFEDAWLEKANYSEMAANYAHYLRDSNFRDKLRPLNTILSKAGDDTRAWYGRTAKDPAPPTGNTDGQRQEQNPVNTQERFSRRENLQPGVRRASSGPSGASPNVIPTPKGRRQVAEDVVAMRRRPGVIALNK